MKIQDSLKKGTIEMIVLFLLQKEEMYGYQLRQEFAKRSDGYYQLPDASLYPTLYRLVENGFIAEREVIIDRRLRRYYHIEPAGKARLDATLGEYLKMTEAIGKVLSYEEANGGEAQEENK